MKTLGQYLREEEEERLFHTSHQATPVDGEKKRFNRRVTWFFSTRHDNEPTKASHEATAIMRRDRANGNQHSSVNVYRPRHPMNLAKEHEVQAAAKEIRHPHHSGPAYELLDSRTTGDHARTRRLVRHLESKGFHGAEHSDYSQIDHQNDRTSVALFRPHAHLEHVETTRDPARLTQGTSK